MRSLHRLTLVFRHLSILVFFLGLQPCAVIRFPAVKFNYGILPIVRLILAVTVVLDYRYVLVVAAKVSMQQ